MMSSVWDDCARTARVRRVQPHALCGARPGIGAHDCKRCADLQAFAEYRGAEELRRELDDPACQRFIPNYVQWRAAAGGVSWFVTTSGGRREGIPA